MWSFEKIEIIFFQSHYKLIVKKLLANKIILKENIYLIFIYENAYKFFYKVQL